MRIGQLKSLTPDELAVLLVMMDVDMSFPKRLLWFKQDQMIKKLSQQESKLTDEGKVIYQSLIVKLNKPWYQEVSEYQESIKSMFTQEELKL